MSRTINSALGPFIERQRALRSAWGVLAPSGLATEKSDIAESGRTLNDDLMELAGQDPSQWSANAITEIGDRLDALESEMRAVAFKVSIPQLRSTLPERISVDRRGVLDLLDLMLGAELRELPGTEDRIPSIDYLITLLCSTGAGGAIQDPILLTPRLHELCERHAVDYDPRLPDIEAEFFAAADLYEADARKELQERALRRRKAELGTGYFAPQVLRAIVTYNTALLHRVDKEVEASQDWGTLQPVEEPLDPTESVFETPALAQIADSLQRRVAGETPEFSPIDRIAWCLDLDFPDDAERRALASGNVGTRQNPVGTTVLVGLLCRSAVVLEEEFPAIGMCASQLEQWVPELAEALQREVNKGIAGDDYQAACVLSELKSKFLYTSMTDVHRKVRDPVPTPPQPGLTPAVAPEPARPESIQESEPSRKVERRASAARNWSRAHIAKLAGAVCALAIIAFVGRPLVWDPDLQHFDRNQLDRVSPYLSRGVRSDEGLGSGFVGGIRDGWSTLEPTDRVLVATDLVEALREQGVREIMIYDASGNLRIQALGEQTPHVLEATPDPEHSQR